MRFKPGRELKEPGHLGKSAQAGDTGCDGRTLGARKGQKEKIAQCTLHLTACRGGDAVGAMDCDPEKASARVGGTWSPYTGPKDPTCLRYRGAP